MDRRIELFGIGGVENLRLVECEPAMPGEGEIRLRHEGIGMNFIDIYHRIGLYPLPLPAVPGVEGAGVVEAVGAGVTDLRVGDRVAYAGLPGAYATTRLLPAWRAIVLPEDIDTRTAAAAFLRGLTAHMLLVRVGGVGPGRSLLIHSAAGGLGTILTRWAKDLGCFVIGTAGTPEKAEIARGNGADHVVVGRDADIGAEVRRLTSGAGVDVAIDGVGGGMLRRTFGCVRPFGLVASIGQSAGPIPPVHLSELGPISLARPSVMAYAAEERAYRTGAQAVIAALRRGILPLPGVEYDLSEAARAQADLEQGRTTGSLLLLP